MQDQVTVEERFAGFPGVSQGGYLGGLLARLLGDTVEVSLRAPPPTNTPLTRQWEGGQGRILAGERVIAEGRVASLDLEVPPPVGLEEAERAARGYIGRTNHPFPGCFCCGTGNPHGLHIFVGPLESRAVMAAPWTPDASLAGTDGRVAPEVVWAALDCPALWAAGYDVVRGSPERGVTGQLLVSSRRAVMAGHRHVVMAWPLGRESRKLFAGSAILDESGETLAVARQTIVLTERGVPLGMWGLKPTA